MISKETLTRRSATKTKQENYNGISSLVIGIYGNGQQKNVTIHRQWKH